MERSEENVREPIALGVGWRGPYGGADEMIGVKLQIEQTLHWLHYIRKLKSFSPSAHPFSRILCQDNQSGILLSGQ